MIARPEAEKRMLIARSTSVGLRDSAIAVSTNSDLDRDGQKDGGHERGPQTGQNGARMDCRRAPEIVIIRRATDD